MSEFVDETPGARPAAAPHSMVPVAEDFDEGAPSQFRPGEKAASTDLWEGEYGNRVLPESTSKLIDKMVADAPVDPDEAEIDAPPADPAAPVEAAQPPAGSQPGNTPLPPGEWQAKLDAEIATRTRMESVNKQLVADLEAARKPPESPPVPKLLNEAGQEYLENDIAAVRKLIAAGHGLDDPNHADVTAELAALTNILTAHVFNVPLDPAHQASRDAARARQLLARDKRERKAESDQAAQRVTAQAETQKADHAASYIGNQLQAKDYPLLTALSHDIDGVSPGHVAWRALETAKKLGKIDETKMSEADLIAYGAKEAETHYQAFRDKILKAIPTSTAEQPAKKPDAPGSASTDQRQSHGARTLTQAAASVAPATSPAVKTRTAQPTRLPSKRDILAKHFPD